MSWKSDQKLLLPHVHHSGDNVPHITFSTPKNILSWVKMSKVLFPCSLISIVYVLLYCKSVENLNQNLERRMSKNESLPIFGIDEWLRHREQLTFRQRNNHLDLVCQKFNLTRHQDENIKNEELLRPNADFNNFVISHKQKLISCLLNKVASSTFVLTFLALKGIIIEEIRSPHAKLKDITVQNMDELQAANKKYFKFMFVRNPISRLLSVYFNKALAFNVSGIKDFGPDVKRRGGQLVKLKKRIRSLGNNDLEKVDPIKPTFEEFLEYILDAFKDGKGFSSHWVPYWSKCTPCAFYYDMIGKLETGTNDFTYLWKKTHLDSVLPLMRINVDPTSAVTRSSPEKLSSILSTLPRSLLVDIYHEYQPDFELFEYNFDETLSLAGHEPLTKEEKIFKLPVIVRT